MNALTFFAQENNLIQWELGFVTLLSIAALVAILIRRIRLPYTVALVLVGLLLSFFPDFLGFTISSDLILAILVPPLLFEATLHIKWEKLKQDLLPVMLLAIGGTLLGTIIVGEIITWVLDIPFMAAIAFGALISATDPVAVIAFFRSLGVSKRLALIMEGESLFNDGVAIVVFHLAIGFVAAGVPDNVLRTAIPQFVEVAFGGLAVGLILGYMVSYVILKNVDDHLIETATTVALAFGSFVIAEQFHWSGILAVVAAGLMVGNIGSQNTSPTTQLTLENFWEFLAFAVNSLVFLLLGLKIQIVQLIPNIIPILVAVIAILLSRAVVVYSISWLHGRLDKRQLIPMSFRHIMFWGGMRGTISLALALTLEATVLETAVAEQLQIMTFGVVLFTLVGQGLTIEKLILYLRLSEIPDVIQEQQRRLAALYAKQSGYSELNRLIKDSILFEDVGAAMATVYAEETEQLRQNFRQHMQNHPELEVEMFLQARHDVLKAERGAISDAYRRGFIAESIYEESIRETDKRVAALEWLRNRQGEQGLLDYENVRRD